MKKLIINLAILTTTFFSLLNLNPVLVKADTQGKLDLTSPRAVVIDFDTNEVIYSLNAEQECQIASTTKLLTALILSENRTKNDLLTFSDIARSLPSSSISRDKLPSINTGEQITADNVIKGLLLSSGNDMAEIIAENISGTSAEFSKLMDEKAKSLNMNHSDFYTPNGLDNDYYLKGENHYSTAYDMALCGQAAYKDDWIRETIAIPYTEFSTVGGLTAPLNNTNGNLGHNGCVGGKTGYTDKAGKCLVAIYNRGDRTLVGVVLGGDSPDFFVDMNKIMDYSFNSERKKILSANDELEETTVSFKPLKNFGDKTEYTLPLFIKEDVFQYSNDFNDAHTDIKINLDDNISAWDIDNDTPLGTVQVTENDRTSTYNLYTNLTTDDFISDHQELYNKVNLIKKCILIFLIIFTFILAFLGHRFVKVKKIKFNFSNKKSCR